MRLALCLEYDGTPYFGWQSQPGGRTVQDVLERALAMVAGKSVRTACAGRTDAGVHALAQIVHFDTEVSRPLSAWVRGVNAHLPPQVAVVWAAEVDSEFHARFSAVARHYRYVLLNRPVRPGLLDGRVGWCFRPLDVDIMLSAAACLVGEHDFSAFRAAGCQAKSPVKTVYRADIVRESDFILFDFSANAFLHHMVRNLVGSLVYVGTGKQPASWMGDVLESRDRSRAAPTFDASGLYFAGVDYEPRWRLPPASRIMPDSFRFLRLPCPEPE